MYNLYLTYKRGQSLKTVRTNMTQKAAKKQARAAVIVIIYLKLNFLFLSDLCNDMY